MMIVMPLKIFEMSAHLGVGDGERNGITGGVAKIQTYQLYIGAGVAWAWFVVGEETARWSPAKLAMEDR